MLLIDNYLRLYNVHMECVILLMKVHRVILDVLVLYEIESMINIHFHNNKQENEEGHWLLNKVVEFCSINILRKKMIMYKDNNIQVMLNNHLLYDSMVTVKNEYLYERKV